MRGRLATYPYYASMANPLHDARDTDNTAGARDSTAAKEMAPLWPFVPGIASAAVPGTIAHQASRDDLSGKITVAIRADTDDPVAITFTIQDAGHGLATRVKTHAGYVQHWSDNTMPDCDSAWFQTELDQGADRELDGNFRAAFIVGCCRQHICTVQDRT